MTNDRIDDLLREIEELRDALKGRTVSCGQCNETAMKYQVALQSRDASLRLLRKKHDECRQLQQEVKRLEFVFNGQFPKSKYLHTFAGQNAVVYARCSTRHQANHGDSLRRQLATCIQFAMQNGIGISDVYCDAGVSGFENGMMKQRNVLLKNWGRLPEAQTKTLVLVESFDRWTRAPSTLDQMVVLIECSKGLWDTQP